MKKLQFVIYLITFFITALNAQQTLTGIVKDETGSAVLGATVQIAGTNTGTSTDADGRFSIRVNPGDKIRISLVGYEIF
jgi:TonB-dependent starch-binding outer membrane protein SusC